MDDKERIVAIMRGGDFSNYPELADLLIADGLGYGKSYDYTAAFNAQDQERIAQLTARLAELEGKIADGTLVAKPDCYNCPNRENDKTCEQCKTELTTYKQEYKLAAAANKGLAEALDKEREENQRLRLMLFAYVRNSAVLPVGLRLKKTEQEITDKTFETIEVAEKMLDKKAVIAAMNLATNKENRYDRE